jgi:hypothetical protein
LHAGEERLHMVAAVAEVHHPVTVAVPQAETHQAEVPADVEDILPRDAAILQAEVQVRLHQTGEATHQAGTLLHQIVGATHQAGVLLHLIVKEVLPAEAEAHLREEALHRCLVKK